ncbi:glutamyl aminopeptidase isoform X1 [Lepeophtheirus salmonis]|uniref:glutamyl aminopeptidase isoform X1 n=2 Tax=Lepeophtheirus salmonis TaxID=72036 RepID=UPI001AE5E86F|nr:glutamyl aminopeptidase-like isoform X1 [Lepeophtheirus salmonis]
MWLFWKILSAMTLSKSWETNYRIPSDTYPLHYDLYLHPDMNGTTFEGRVSISIDVRAPRDFLVTHINFLNITSTELINDDNGEKVSLESSFEYKPNEFWVVKTNEMIQPGKYRLNLEFIGRLDNGIIGFYRSSYIDEKGIKRTMVSSKFQPTYARRAFPCFDEPSFKSTYTITVVKPKEESYIALSNMPVSEIKEGYPSSEMTEVKFEKSVPMVTYLVVFMVSEYEYMEKAVEGFDTRFRVYGSELQMDKLEYALNVGVHVVAYYQSYFGLKFPLPKLDMAAIPEYPSGATEHWGLITYRETALIFDNKTSSADNRERVANVIAHELAHQWFGNLVTVAWWNDLWLNEGFASYIQYKGLKSYESDWDTDSKFLTDTMHSVLKLDATTASHPIVVKVDNPDQITAVFDAISYNKGSSVIRMMENFMGPEDFRKGISNFLKKYSYKTVVTQNLFDELTSASSLGLDITKIMSTWTMQKGYPVLTVTKSANNTYKIVQERFLQNPDAAVNDTPSDFDYKWEVPVTYVDSNGKKDQSWIHVEDSHIEINSSAEWVKFNVEQRGYYRVNYSPDVWQQFIDLLIKSPSILSVSDKTGLINDAFSLAKSTADRLSMKVPLSLIRYLNIERSLAPWEAAINELYFLNSIFQNVNDIKEGLFSFEKSLIQDLYADLGWNDGSGTHDVKQLRKRVIALACRIGHQDCLSTAKKQFLDWKDSGKEPVPNFKAIVCRYGLPHDDESWNWLLELYKAEKNAQRRAVLEVGLSSSKNPEILRKFIQMAKDEEIVRRQDYFTLLSVISRNVVGESIVWDFLRNEWEYLVDRFTLNDRLFGRFISTATSGFSSQERLQEMKDFFAKYPEAGAGENYRKIAIETVENNMQFIEKHSETIRSWLGENVI